MKNLMKLLLVTLFAILIILLISNLWVVFSTDKDIYHSTSEIKFYEVGLVLGTSDKVANGDDNPFFIGRIEAAVTLYKAGKIKRLIVSGDNRTKYYNEPLKMQQALIERGVPENVIILDYEGLRTLDSIIRCKEVFGYNDVIIISQKFHCHRAVFISNYYNMNISGFATQKIPFQESFKVVLREIAARPVAIWDTYIINKHPNSYI